MEGFKAPIPTKLERAPLAQRWKRYERQACRDRAAQSPDKCNPVGTGREDVANLRGFPHCRRTDRAEKNSRRCQTGGSALSAKCPVIRTPAEGVGRDSRRLGLRID